jgi:hypothetical protein
MKAFLEQQASISQAQLNKGFILLLMRLAL